MEKNIKQLCQCWNDMSEGEAVIANNLLSKTEVAALMGMVDVRRKGYLDLNDIYELVGSVTESELFYLFKALDGERSGEVKE